MSKAMVVSSCSAVALPTGSLTNLTMDPQGKLCLTGISGTGGCAQATNYLARTVGGNEGGNPFPITALICGLVTDGVWSNLDALYVLAQQNETDAKLNLVGTSYTLSQAGSFSQINPNIGTIIFASYVGFHGFVTVGSYLDTGLNPSTATTPKFVQNSASFGVWSYNVPVVSVSSGGDIGNSTAATGRSNILIALLLTAYFFSR